MFNEFYLFSNQSKINITECIEKIKELQKNFYEQKKKRTFIIQKISIIFILYHTGLLFSYQKMSPAKFD